MSPLRKLKRFWDKVRVALRLKKKPSKPSPPKPSGLSSDQRLNEIRITATPAPRRPDRTEYEFYFEDGHKLHFFQHNVREVWGSISASAHGTLTFPDGTAHAIDVNTLVRHGALSDVPASVRANFTSYGDPVLPDIPYSTSWLYWMTANGKKMYVTSDYADLYTIRAVEATKKGFGVYSPISGVHVVRSSQTFIREGGSH